MRQRKGRNLLSVLSVLRSARNGGPSRALLEWTVLGALLSALAAYVALELHASHLAVETTERTRLEHQAQMVEKMLGTRLQATVNALDALRADAPGAPGPGGRRLPDGRAHAGDGLVHDRRAHLPPGERPGVAVASNRKELVGTDWRKGERYQAIRAHPDAARLYVSPPFMTPLGNWALSLGRALLDPVGGFDGYVLAIIDPEYFQLLLDSARYAPDMATAMIHGGGMVIFRVPDPKGAIGMNLAERPGLGVRRHVRSGQPLSSWTARLSSTGVEALVVLRPSTPRRAILTVSWSPASAGRPRPCSPRGERR